MREIVRPLIPVAVLMLLLVLPFLLFGADLERAVEGWLRSDQSAWVMALAVAGILATDIFLPVPSSLVSTLGGVSLGTWGGTAASWVGLTVGAVIGFSLARLLGPPLAERFSRPEDLARTQRATDRVGPLVLVLTRAVPVLAEASVLLLGATGLPWRRFLPPVMASNLGIALAYSALGEIAQHWHTLPFVLAVSIALPVLIAMLARRWLPG